jgi:hypothetical protein
LLAELANIPDETLQGLIIKAEQHQKERNGVNVPPPKASPFEVKKSYGKQPKPQRIDVSEKKVTPPSRPSPTHEGSVELKTVAPRDLVWEVIFVDFLGCDLANAEQHKFWDGWTGKLKSILVDCLPDITPEDTRLFVTHWKESNAYATKTRDEEKIRSAIGEWHKSVEPAKAKLERPKCAACGGQGATMGKDGRGRNVAVQCPKCGGSGHE